MYNFGRKEVPGITRALDSVFKETYKLIDGIHIVITSWQDFTQISFKQAKRLRKSLMLCSGVCL